MDVILFDLDDTLFDQKHCSRAGLAAVQKAYPGRIDNSIEEIESDYRELLEQWHKRVVDGSMTIEESRVERFRILLARDQTAATEDEARQAAICYCEAYNAAYRPVPGAIELLQRLKSEHRIGIVTQRHDELGRG